MVVVLLVGGVDYSSSSRVVRSLDDGGCLLLRKLDCDYHVT